MSQPTIRTKPEPLCPECGSKMVLRRPKPGQNWQPFWGCYDFPDCRGVRHIMPDGEPEEDDLDLDGYEVHGWE